MGQELTDEVCDELIHKGIESPDLDYKGAFDASTGAWMEIAKDIYAMANYGGGCIVIGVEDASFNPVGLDTSFHIDTQIWSDKVSAWATGNVKLSYKEYQTTISGTMKKFPIIQIEGSAGTFIIPKNDGTYTTAKGNKTAFKQGVIYTRKVNASAAASADEQATLFWNLLKRTSSAAGSSSIPLEVLNVLLNKAKPDNTEEALWSNIFPVTELPDYIYAGVSKFDKADEVYKHINEKRMEDAVEERIPAFYMTDGKIYTFSELSEDNPLALCVYNQEKISITDWLSNNVNQQKLISLLNFNLKNLCARRGFWYDKKRDRFFRKDFGGDLPTITWKPYKVQRPRQLVYRKFSNETNTLIYCEHFGGILKFIMLGDGVYLLIEPTRVVTRDGIEPLDWKRNVVVSTKSNFRYHNNNYLYDTKLWLQLLGGTKNEIHLGPGNAKVVVSILSLNSKLSIGITDDQHTDEGFLDELKSEPMEYEVEREDKEDYNPVTENPFEG